MSFLRDRQNKAAYAKAKRQADEEGGRVCGTVDDEGTPIYFVVPQDATDEQIQARAFELKHGRPMNQAESLLQAAQNGSFVDAFEQAMRHYLSGKEVIAEETARIKEQIDAVG